MSQHCNSRGCWERVTTEPPARDERPLDHRDGAEIARLVEERWLGRAR
jgi:hypothetical protein